MKNRSDDNPNAVSNLKYDNNVGREPAKRSFLSALGARTRLIDLALLSVIPAVLTVVFHLPARTRREFAFEYTDPTVLTAFTANFVHLTLDHLLLNVTTFVIVVSLAYVVSVMTGRRRRFYLVFFIFTLGLPPILSYLNLAFPRPGFAVGFSGVVMAFVGYLAFALADYAELHFDVGPRKSAAPAVFFASLSLIVLLLVRSISPITTPVLLGASGLSVATGLVAATYLFDITRAEGRTYSKIKQVMNRQGYVDLMIVVSAAFVGFLFVAFPASPLPGSATLNVYVHFAGYSIGFILVYTVIEFAGHAGYTVPLAKSGWLLDSTM